MSSSTRLLVEAEREQDETSQAFSTQSEVYGYRHQSHPYGLFRTKFVSNLKAIKNSFWIRLPKNKQILYVLLLTLLQSYAFYMVSDGMIGPQSLKVLVGVVSVGFPAIFFPLGGILGDVYIGRHRMSLISLFISWATYILLTISLIISYCCSFPFHHNPLHTISSIVLPLASLIIIGITDGIFRINWLTFSADQLINAPSEEIDAFIYYWYWSGNLGLLLARLTSLALTFLADDQLILQLLSLISATALTAILLIDRAIKNQFEVDRRNPNPIKHIFGVLCNAVVSRPKNLFISAFRYGEDPPSGLEFAREYHGGKYSDEQVDDVRSFAKIALIILSLSGFSATYAGVGLMNTYQFINVTSSTNEAPIAYIQDRFTFLGQNVVVVILVPLWNNIIFPLMGHYLPNTRKRVGIGLALGCLACIASVIIPAVLKIHYSWYWLCIPTVLIGIAETSVYIPIFIYAQSPDNMKGLLIGCHYLIIGIWSAIAAVVDYFLKQNTSHQNDVIVGYYAVLTAISFIGLVIFSFISYFYRNRKRNNPITDLLRISMYY